ncbi:MAG: prepilin-type N-terminal cleavage/methylation domain-containing protein [Bacteroidetes bacterium]|nr:prepilin-type N-terminal cleavage/methylation domain-containing protein [Bacteroidota bacterium]
MKRALSFTLIELIIVLFLTGMVTAIGYTSFNIIKREFFSFRTNAMALVDISWLNAILQRDILNAREVRRENESVILVFRNMPPVTYRFAHSFILRKSDSATDTFHLSYRNLRMNLFKNEQAIHGGLVDEIMVDVVSESAVYPLHLRKQYGADILMNL